MPPATGEAPHITMRLSHDLLDTINKWGTQKGLKRSAALRQLLEMGLKKGRK